jgi:DNA-binding GntR family transcriptional regulator
MDTDIRHSVYQTAMPPINRRALRHDVRQEILAMIFDGRLPAGERINERDLGAELDVSRTPIREALLGLESEGFVHSRPARGFAPAPLSARDVNDVYPMVAALEILAVRSTPPERLRARLPELERIAEQMAAARSAKRAQALDDRWHARLAGDCDNERLLDTLASLKRVVRRYELAWMADNAHVQTSTEQHHAIVEALGRDDVDRAAELLDLNWRYTMAEMLAWLTRRPPSASP